MINEKKGTDNFFLSVPSDIKRAQITKRAQIGHRSFLAICALTSALFCWAFCIKGTEGTDKVSNIYNISKIGKIGKITPKNTFIKNIQQKAYLSVPCALLGFST